MDQLVLGAKAREALGMALAQARNPALLRDAWGMGEKVAYGRATTLLFSGDPGTGPRGARTSTPASRKTPPDNSSKFSESDVYRCRTPLDMVESSLHEGLSTRSVRGGKVGA